MNHTQYWRCLISTKLYKQISNSPLINPDKLTLIRQYLINVFQVCYSLWSCFYGGQLILNAPITILRSCSHLEDITFLITFQKLQCFTPSIPSAVRRLGSLPSALHHPLSWDVTAWVLAVQQNDSPAQCAVHMQVHKEQPCAGKVERAFHKDLAKMYGHAG